VSDTIIISLDLETTGLKVGTHVPLSIGAVKLDRRCHSINSGNSFYVQLEWDSVMVDPKALQVNKLDIVNPPGGNGPLHNKSLPAKDGLIAFNKWLDLIPWDGHSRVVAMGKNVGAFDLPMLRSIWNQFDTGMRWPFHYRSIDINTLFFTLSEIMGSSFEDIQTKITEIAWQRVGVLVGPRIPSKHHALMDAWWNVYARQECINMLVEHGVKV
jgi:hypothetical protein